MPPPDHRLDRRDLDVGIRQVAVGVNARLCRSDALGLRGIIGMAEDSGQFARHEVRRGRNAAPAAKAHQRQQQRVGAGQHCKAGKAGDHRLHVLDLAGGILDAHNDSGEGCYKSFDQIVADRQARHLRDVIQDHPKPWIADAFDDAGIGSEEPVIADALVVERGQHHDRRNPARERVTGQLHGLGDVRKTRAGQKAGRRDTGRESGLKDCAAFGRGEGVGLSCGAQQRDAVAAILDKRMAMRGEGRKVGGKVRRQRRCRGTKDTGYGISHSWALRVAAMRRA